MFYRHREVEVTSVNWETKDTAAVASQVLVSYRWHGIMYAVKFLTAISSFHLILFRCWDLKKMTALWRLSMDEW